MEDLNFQRTIDPRVNVNDSRYRTYGLYSGGSSNTWYNYVSTSFNNSVVNFNMPPPNERVYVDRNPYIEVVFQLGFVGTSPGAGVPLLQCAGLPAAPGVNPGTLYRDGPRCKPLSQAMTNIQVSMNNDTISTNLNTYSKVFQWFHESKAEQNGDLSSSPSMPDMSQNISDLDGFVLNPLAGYGDNVVQAARGGFTGCLVTRNDSTGSAGDQATVTMRVIEPIMMSPFQWAINQESLAFNMIRTMTMQVVLGGKGSGALSGLPAALWSHMDSGSTLTSVTANVLSATAYFNYIQPDMLTQMPRQINYSYAEPTLYPTSSLATVNPGVPTNYTMNTVNLQSIPNVMYIWVSERDQDFNITKSDSAYFKIERVNIQFNAQDGLLNNCRDIQLFEMSRKNGYVGSWDQWNLRTGSVLCIKFGSDIALGELQCPGLGETQNLSMTVTATNLGGTAVVPSLNVLVFQEGVMMINNGSIYRSVGLVTREDVIASKEQKAVSYVSSKNVYGSGFFGDLWTGIKSLIRPAIEGAKVLAPANPFVMAADAAAKSAGYGRVIGGGVTGGRLLLH